VTPLFFEHFLGKESCATPEEVRAVLAKSLDGYNEFIVADAPWVPGAGPYPYLSVLVKDRHAYLWYAPDDGSAGIQAYGPEELGLDPHGFTAFHITPGGEVLKVCNDYVCPLEAAVEVLLAWLDLPGWPARTEELPALVRWEEL
jgi:hypothetical protein